MNYPTIDILKDSQEDDNIIHVTDDELIYHGSRPAIELISRSGGELESRAFCLPSDADWIIVRDSNGQLCLVPLRKRK
jgi:hypothetical protein